MRLDDATDFSDIRVQCLGKDYPPTEAAWQCLAEVRQLRKEHEQDPKAPDNDREKVFAEVQQKFINERPRQGAVHNILSGFGLTDDKSNETPKQRIDRFKEDLRIQENGGTIRDTVKAVRGWFGY
jgi:hypothetical protein